MDLALSAAQREVQEKARRAAQEVKELAGRLDRQGQAPLEILEL